MTQAKDPATLREELIRRRLAGARRSRASISRVDRSGPLALSFGQQRIWLLHQLDPDSPEYLVPMAMRLRGPLSTAALWLAWDAMVARHEVLRTRYGFADGEPVQVIDEPRPIPVREADLTGLPVEDRLPAAMAVFEAEARTAIDLARDWPLRIWLGKLGEDDHVMIAVYHHIAFDGWSLGVIDREWPALYLGYALGRQDPAADLPAAPVQYADYAAWQRTRLSGAMLARELAFWRDRLTGIPPLNLPTDRPRPPVRRDWAGGKSEFRIPPELGERLRQVGREQQATLFMVLLTAFQVLLSRYSGQRDLGIGTPVAGRVLPEISGMIGFTVNTLVIRSTWHGDPDFPDLLRATRSTVLDALDHQELPFERLVDDLQPERDLSRNPLFQVMFGLHNQESGEGDHGILKAETLLTDGSVAKFDLNLQFEETPGGGLFGVLDYAAALFDAATITRMTTHFQALLHGIAADPHRPISAFTLHTPDDRGHLPELDSLLVTDRVERWAREQPDAVALRVDGQSVSYADLDGQANRLAWRLRDLGVGPEKRVAVCLPRGRQLVPALLGVWKAGGAYLPLDPDHPPARLLDTLTDSAAHCVVTDSGLAELFDGWQVLVMDDETRPAPPERVTEREGLAYVIYTSGSTGRPKGVLVTHANLARLLAATSGFGFGPEDVWTLFHSAAFDFSVWEMWGALAGGGRLVVVPYGVSRSPEEFRELLVAERVTVLNQTPSAFAGLAASAVPGQALRLVIFGGERLEAASVPSWPGVEFVNMYGITETTVHVTEHRVDPAERGAGSLIGRALTDLHAQVVDCYGELAPPGVAGEIHVGGAGVARGYLGRPGLTAERFLPDPHGPPGSRRYRSGDRARSHADGTLEFLGRTDDQLTLRGYRIEPAEIEANLLLHSAVRAAAVTVRQGRLIAYVVGSPEGLRAHCARLLPAHMVPALFVQLDQLPLTANGKTDRAALPDPDPTAALADTLSGARVPPGTRTEALMLAEWGRVLGQVSGVTDDFFERGGDSLRAVALVGQLRAAGFDVAVRDVFEQRTVAGLARLADQRPTAPQRPPTEPFALLGPEDRALVPAGAVDAYPLSQVQAGMVYQSLAHPARGYYHDTFSYSIRDDKPFSLDALRRAAAAVVARHENLRTAIDLHTFSEPLQIVYGHAELAVDLIDQATARAGLAAEPFELDKAPLLRLAVAVESPDRWRLLVSLHHAIIEGWSQHLLLMELLDLYLNAAEPSPAEPSPAEPLSGGVRYADFVAAERIALASPEDQEYWARVLAGRSRWTIPEDWGDLDAGDEVDHLRVDLLDAYEGLRRLALVAGVPLKSVLLAAHLKVLSLFGADDAFHSGLICDARPEVAGADRLHGMLLNIVPFPFRLDASTWTDLVRAVFRTEVDLWPHRRFPLPEMERRWGGAAPEVFFNYLDFNLVDGDRVDLFDSTGETPNEFPLEVTTLSGTLTLTTARRLISLEAAGALADAYRTVLTAMATNPDGDALATPGGAPPQTAVAVPWQPVPALVAERARTTPQAVAVTYAAEQPGAPMEVVTFAELHHRARQVAGWLRESGAEGVVGVCLDRGPDLLVALLATWYAGVAYLPLDPAWPRRRRAEVLADAGAHLVLTELRGAEPVEPAAVDPESLAYVIYTSGSTGAPKGVEVTHRNLAAYLAAAEGRGSAPLFTSVAYDLAVTTLFAPLVNGERVHLLPPAFDLADLGRLLLAGGPYDFVKLTPSHLEALSHLLAPGEATGLARAWIIGGEPLSTTLAERWQAAAPGALLLNEYGPTETTVACTAHPFGTCPPGRVPVGRPLAGALVRVLDRWFEPRPPGIPGEVMIGGAGVARGYRGGPALTAERFVPDPHGPPGSRLYRSGDLGRLLPTGDLDLLGRSDDQEKIRGHRVEPGELAATLSSHPEVAHAAAIAAEGRLIGYVVSGTAEDALIEWLGERLPSHLVPARVIKIDRVPLTANGKLDRAALPVPDPGRGSRPPRSATERAMAALWCAALGLESVGVDDDFFELGGHSLLILRVVTLATRAGLPLRTHDVLELRTVRAVADRLDHPAPADTLFWLRGKAAGTPLFTVHPAGGASHWYRPLADRLDRPVAAFAVPDLRAAGDIGRLAAHYVGQLARTTEPVHLFAWSSGSTIAWEMAAQLLTAGRPVAALVLADPMADLPGSNVGADTFDRLEDLLREPGNRLTRRVIDYRAAKLLQGLGITATRNDFEGLAREIALWRTLDQATADYIFSPLPIPVRLIASDDCASGRHTVTGREPYQRYLARWRELAGGGLQVTRLGSSHEGLFHPPYVDQLAEVTSGA